MKAHSVAWCQSSPRMPPALSRMLTPEAALEIGKSPCVTWRAHPPSRMRLCALLKDARTCRMSPTSVEGGLMALGNCDANAGFFGPGSSWLPALALIAPCGGSSVLLKDAALAEESVAATVSAAPKASKLRRENGAMALLIRLDEMTRPPVALRYEPSSRHLACFRGNASLYVFIAQCMLRMVRALPGCASAMRQLAYDALTDARSVARSQRWAAW
jgi:hypothetical protein